MTKRFQGPGVIVCALALILALGNSSALGQSNQDGRWHSDEPRFFTDFVLPKGEHMHDSTVFKGSTTINGEVEHDCVTVFGNGTVNGKVGNNLVVIMGTAELGPDADIGGQVIVIGGQLKEAPGARIAGEKIVAHIPGLLPAVDWITKGLLLGRPFPPGVGWAWVFAMMLLLINILLLLLFPHAIQACVDTIERKPITSFFAGILVKLLIGLFLALLAITVVGLIVAPFLVAAAMVGFLFGKITAYRYVGQQLTKSIRSDFLQNPFITLILGTAVFYLLYMIPFVGFVAWGFSGVFGLGAVGVAAIGKLRSERPKAAPPVPAATPAPSPAVAMPAQSTPSSAFVPPGPSIAAAAPAAPFASQTLSPPFVPAPGISAAPLDVSLLPRAGFWIRLAALAMDVILFAVVMAVLGPHEGGSHEGHTRFYAFLWLTYCVVLWAWRGTTIGGIVMGIRVVRLDGRPLDFPSALIRGLACILSVLPLGLGFIWVAIDSEKRAWHDRIAGTVMLKVPKSSALG